MRCPKCGSSATRVVDSGSQESTNAIKRNGTTQPFDRSKLLAGLVHATAKRDIDLSKLNNLIDDIEHELRTKAQTSVTSHQLGDMVLMRLEKLDKVAYIRFASVYRDFKDVEEFTAELKKLE